MSDIFDALADTREAQTEPRPYDPGENNRRLQAYADDVLIHHGLRAPAPKPGEASRTYLARLGETFDPLIPPERRGIDRYAMPFSSAAAMLRVDCEQARAEIDNPKHSLKDGEIREVIRLDDSGRPVHTFHSRTEGPGFWLRDFASSIVRMVSQGSNGIATPKNPRPPGYRFDKSDLPEYRALRRREAWLNSPEYRLLKVYADAGAPPPSPAELKTMIRK